MNDHNFVTQKFHTSFAMIGTKEADKPLGGSKAVPQQGSKQKAELAIVLVDDCWLVPECLVIENS